MYRWLLLLSACSTPEFLTLQTRKGNRGFATSNGLVTAAGREETMARYYPSSLQGELKTLGEWKARFGFSNQPVAIYYNENELALGRALACAELGESVACYVTNYGERFGDRDDALKRALHDGPRRNTVVISYQPELPPEYRVQFAAYGPDDQLLDAAQLDTLGYRPIPQVCVNCHGGVYDAELGLAKNAHFLPANVFALRFAGEVPIDVFRAINALALKRPELLTDAQRESIDAFDALDPERVPSAWANDRALWQETVLPYCATCHAALPPEGVDYTRTPEVYAKSWRHVVCDTHSMPHAQPTYREFWQKARCP